MKIFKNVKSATTIIPLLLLLPAAFIAYILLAPMGQEPEQISTIIPEPPTGIVLDHTQKDVAEASYSAQFLIFTHGTKRIFTDSRYHNLNQNVFIDPQETTTVQVRKDGITWQDFFNSLPMSLDSSCLVTGTGQRFCNGEGGELVFVINNIEDPQALSREIQVGDKLLVSFGENRDRIEDELLNFELTD